MWGNILVEVGPIFPYVVSIFVRTKFILFAVEPNLFRMGTNVARIVPIVDAVGNIWTRGPVTSRGKTIEYMCIIEDF